jgi:hypothetical protein
MAWYGDLIKLVRDNPQADEDERGNSAMRNNQPATAPSDRALAG